MKRLYPTILSVIALCLIFIACEKENRSIDPSFTLNSISVEYPGGLIYDLTSDDTIIVDTSGVLTYNFTLSAEQDIMQVSSFNSYWNLSSTNENFNNGYGELFAREGFDNGKSITFDLIVDLSDNTNPNVDRSVYPNHNTILHQITVEGSISKDTVLSYSIYTDSTLVN